MKQILPAAATDSAEVVCGAEAAHCICDEPHGHTTPHACKCGGKWRGTLDEPDFDVVAWPTAVRQ